MPAVTEAEVRALGLDPSAIAEFDLPGRPRPILAFPVEVRNVVSEWQRLRALSVHGWWPVVVADEDAGPEDVWEAIEDDSLTPEAIIAAAGEPSAEAWLGKRRAEMQEDSEDLTYWEIDEDEYVSCRSRSTPSEVPEVLATSALGATTSTRTMILVPTAFSWEVPAWVDWWGACNYDIEPADHVRMLRSWQERFGAEVFAMSMSTIELALTEPVTDRPTAEIVAREQYAYCPDTIEQGVESMAALVAGVQGAKYWWFWWD